VHATTLDRRPPELGLAGHDRQPDPELRLDEQGQRAAEGRDLRRQPGERKLREEKYQLARAGVKGCRSWIAFLAERNEDPKWESTFVDEVGKLRGEDLLKATAVVEYVQELNLLGDLLKKVGLAKRTDKTYPVMGKALGSTVSEFEARWRAWIIPRTAASPRRSTRSPTWGTAPTSSRR